MTVIPLTSTEQTQAQANQAAIAAAQAALRTAQQTAQTYLKGIAASGSPPVTSGRRFLLDSTGENLVVF